MAFNNPDMPWSEVEALLSGRKPSDPAASSGRGQGGRGKDGREPGSPSWNAGGDGPAWTRKRQPYVPPSGSDADVTRPLLRPDAPYTPYAELHCHSNFSFLDGASHPEQLAEEANRLGLEALAITDHNGFYGVGEGKGRSGSGFAVVERGRRRPGVDPQAATVCASQWQRCRCHPAVAAPRCAVHAVCRAALPQQLLVPRRRLASRTTGRRGQPTGARSAGDHRPQRVLRRRPLRRGGTGGRPADGVRHRGHPHRRRGCRRGRSGAPAQPVRGRHPGAAAGHHTGRAARPRSARRAPAAARRRPHRLRPARAGTQPRPPGGREGRAAVHDGRHRRCLQRPRLGAHRLPQGHGAGGAGARWPGRGGAPAAAAGRRLRPRPGGGRAVGPRQPARLGAQRCAGRTGGASRRRLHRHQQRPLRHPSAAAARVGGRRCAGPAQPRRSRPVAAGLVGRASAQRCRTGAAVPALSRCGRVGGADRAGRCVRPVTGRAAAAAVSLPGWSARPRWCAPPAHRDAVPAPAGRGRGSTPLRRTPGRARRPVGACPGVAHDRPRAAGHRGARFRRLLPGGVGHRRVLQPRQHLLPGPGQRSQQRGLLRAGHHQGGRGVTGVAVRAVPVARA